MKGTLYRLVNGRSMTVTSFDEQNLPYIFQSKYRLMDAEDIVLMIK